MANICLQCGDKGFPEALIYCNKCQIYAVHMYCLDALPKIFDEYVGWSCCDCLPNSVDTSTLDEANSHLVGQNGPENLKKTCNKKRNNARRKGKHCRRKAAHCSLTKADLLELTNNSSLQTSEMHFSSNGEMDPELRTRNSMEIENFDEVVKAFQGENLELAIPDSHPTELACLNADENDQKLEEQNGSDRDRFHEEADSLEIKNSLVVTPDLQVIVSNGSEDRNNVQNSRNESNFCEEEESLITKNPEPAADIAEQSCCAVARPVKDPIWRGSISIVGKDYGDSCGIVAHLSSIACLKVRETTKSLPELLSPELLPRSAIWPKGFRQWGPSDGSIALYFFPDNERNEKTNSSLVNDMISHDLAMKVVLENAELLIYTSNVLPMDYWRFQDKFYLWGVFRGKQPSGVAADVVPEEGQRLGNVTV